MALELSGLTKRFGRDVVLEDVTLVLEPGDIYGFVGHNGSGKTTAMRIALGLARPTSGAVIVDGFEAAAHPREAHALVGGLIETAGFHGAWNARENLRLLARLHGMDRAAASAACEDVLEQVGLSAAAHRPVQDYSQGMRQRLGIGAALLGSPRYLLLDEPMNALDPEGIAALRALLLELARERGTGVFVSSHQLADLSTFATRIGVLRQGRLVLESPTSELFGSGARRYDVAARDTEALDRALAERGMTVLERTGSARLVDLEGRAAAPLLRELVGARVEVESFAPRPRTLEEIYLASASASERLRAPVARARSSERTSPTRRIAPGGALARAVGGELARWRRSKGVWIAGAMPVAVAVLAMLARASSGERNEADVAGATLFSATRVGAFEAVGVGLCAGLPVLAFALLGLASQSIAGELARGTLRNTLQRPFSRADVALGKGLALAIALVAGYALLAGSVLAFAAARFDFKDVVDVLPDGKEFPLVAAAELWPELWTAVASPLVPLVAYASIGFLCGAIARGSAAALALALGAGVALDLARALFARGTAAWLPSAHLPSPLSDESRIRFYVDVSQGIGNASFDLGGARAAWPLLWCAVCFALAARSLVRRDVP